MRERLWFVRRKQNSYFLILLWPDSYFGDGIQQAKQLVFVRLPQMTKYFVKRECEMDISVLWLIICSQEGIYIFKYPKGFWRSLSEISQFYCTLNFLRIRYQHPLVCVTMIIYKAQPRILTNGQLLQGYVATQVSHFSTTNSQNWNTKKGSQTSCIPVDNRHAKSIWSNESINGSWCTMCITWPQ